MTTMTPTPWKTKAKYRIDSEPVPGRVIHINEQDEDAFVTVVSQDITKENAEYIKRNSLRLSAEDQLNSLNNFNGHHNCPVIGMVSSPFAHLPAYLEENEESDTTYPHDRVPLIDGYGLTTLVQGKVMVTKWRKQTNDQRYAGAQFIAGTGLGAKRFAPESDGGFAIETPGFNDVMVPLYGNEITTRLFEMRESLLDLIVLSDEVDTDDDSPKLTAAMFRGEYASQKISGKIMRMVGGNVAHFSAIRLPELIHDVWFDTNHNKPGYDPNLYAGADHIVIAHIYLNSYRVLYDILHNSNVFRDLTPWDTKRKPSTLLGLSERIML